MDKRDLTLGFKITEWKYAEIEELFHSERHRHRFKRMSEFHRYVYDRGLDAFASEAPTSKTVSVSRGMDMFLALEQEAQELDKRLSLLAQVVKDYRISGELDDADRVKETVARMVAEMADGSRKSKYLRKLEEI